MVHHQLDREQKKFEEADWFFIADKVVGARRLTGSLLQRKLRELEVDRFFIAEKFVGARD